MSIAIKIMILSIFSLIGSNDSVTCTDGSLVSDGMETLCIIERYDEALHLYGRYIKGDKEMEEYLSVKTAMKLFSNTSRKEEYLCFLERYLYKGGEEKQLHYYTNRSFYEAYQSEIDSIVNTTIPASIEKVDSLIIENFLFVDQEIRRTRGLSKSEWSRRDSINQLTIKRLLKERRCTNYQIGEALSLLLRHASSEYLYSIKASGLIDFYISKGVITKEKYYDAVGYVTDDEYFTISKDADNEEVALLNEKRESVGLLPLKLSPIVNGRNEIRVNLPKEESLRYTYTANEMSNYIQDRCLK